MINVSRKALVLGAVASLGTAGVLALAGPASAAQTIMSFDCAGVGPVTIRVNTNHSSDNGGWGAAQVSTGGHGIPVAFSFTLTDTATGATQGITQPKGSGNANQNTTGTHTTCSQTATGTVGDFLNPGEPVPPGMSVDDPATATFAATVVLKS
jgi:hypothetical protein